MSALQQTLLALAVAAGGGATDPYFANVQALLHFDGTPGSGTFLDSSSFGRTVTTGGTISASNAKFGQSGLLNGVDTSVPISSINLRTHAWTAETSLHSNLTTAEILTLGAGGGDLYLEVISGTLYLGDGVTNNIVASVSITSGVREDWAVSFDPADPIALGPIYRVFKNGTEVANSTTLLKSTTTTEFHIGARPGVASYANGYFDESRFSDVCRYTGSYTPDAAPFPDA